MLALLFAGEASYMVATPALRLATPVMQTPPVSRLATPVMQMGELPPAIGSSVGKSRLNGPAAPNGPIVVQGGRSSPCDREL